jgi:type II secretory pathway pseudopilin PulG
VLKHLNNKGDTIVEVLIAVAVMSLVLGVSFVGSNRAYSDIRDAQQHQIATTIAQTQLEDLNALKDLSSITSSDSSTCFINNNLVTSGCSNYIYSGYNLPFNVNLKLNPNVNTTPKTYEVDITWQNTTGSTNLDQVQMFYQTDGS